MRALHLFAGMGGSHLAGMLVGWESVGSVEIDPACQRILRAYFPNEPLHDDVQTFRGDGLRGHVDVVLMGFPCTDLSTSGEQKGVVEGDASSLFFDGVRIAHEAQSPLILLENVRGIFTAPGNLKESPERIGESFEIVLRELQAKGYGSVTWLTNRASEVGAPHYRPRVWMLAQRTGKPVSGSWTRPRDWGTSGAVRGNALQMERSTFPLVEDSSYWPTPDASQVGKITPHPAAQMGVWKAIYKAEGRQWVIGKKGQAAPNPNWVESLMGWPIGWSTGGVGDTGGAGDWPALHGMWPALMNQPQHDWEPSRLIDRGEREIGPILRAIGNAWVPHQAAQAWVRLRAAAGV